MWILYLTAAGLAVGTATTALLARRERWRWVVTEIVEKTAAEGPYRGWRAEERVHRARVPAAVLAASALAPAWGLAIGLAFAPAGVALALILLAGRGMVPTILALPLVAVALHGFGLSAGLIGAPAALLRRRRASLDRLIRITRRHHVAVLAVLSAVAYAIDEAALFVAAAFPAAIGLALAILFGVAAAHSRRIASTGSGRHDREIGTPSGPAATTTRWPTSSDISTSTSGTGRSCPASARSSST
jgi:hypothetical protein